MTKSKEASTRRIAIVLASLPQPIAQRLLGSLQGDSQRQVRAALGSLDDVDPLERRRALDGFAYSLRNDKGQPPQSDAAEVVFSKAALRSLNDQDKASSTTPPAPLAFLLDVDDETMVSHLSAEMPQTLAIILASISPAQAARVLPRLDVNVRADAMRRMANLRELPSELIDEIGTQLRSRLVPTIGPDGKAGRRALDAILAEMPQENRQPQAPMVPATRTESQPKRLPAEQLQPSVRLADGTWPDHKRDELQQADEATAKANKSLLLSTDSIHAYLITLPIDRLREALGRVAVRQALLTLCGLPNSTAEAVLSSLPRRQAKQVREQLASLGALQLREIDEAKEAVATQAMNDHSNVAMPKMAMAA